MKHRFSPMSGQIPSLDESTSGKKAGNSLHLENGKHMLFITWGTYQLVPGGAMQLGNPDRCLYRLRTVPAESGSIQGLRTLVYLAVAGRDSDLRRRIQRIGHQCPLGQGCPCKRWMSSLAMSANRSAEAFASRSPTEYPEAP